MLDNYGTEFYHRSHYAGGDCRRSARRQENHVEAANADHENVPVSPGLLYAICALNFLYYFLYVDRSCGCGRGDGRRESVSEQQLLLLVVAARAPQHRL